MNRPQIRTIIIVSVLLAAVCVLASGLLSRFYPYSKLDIFRSEFRPTDWQKTDEVALDGLRLRVRDEQGLPVVGAVVGDTLWGSFSTTTEPSGAARETEHKARRVDISETEHGLLLFITRSPVLESNEDGVIDIPNEALLAAGTEWPSGRPHTLYVIHPSRRIGALACYRPRDTGSVAHLTLLPLCHVQGAIQRADGEPVEFANVVAFWGPVRPWRMHVSKQEVRRRMNMLLPPGQYRIWCGIPEMNAQGERSMISAARTINIQDGMRNLELNMELERTKHSN